MDPMTMYLLISGLSAGGQALNNAFAPSTTTGQTRESFGGPVNAQLLEQANNSMVGLGNNLVEKSKQPVQLKSAIAQTPGGFKAGHGLPMNIGLSGMDPAMSDPSVLSRSPLNLSIPPITSAQTLTGTDGPQPAIPSATSSGSSGTPMGGDTGGGNGQTPDWMNMQPLDSHMQVGGGSTGDPAAPNNMSEAQQIMDALNLAGGGGGGMTDYWRNPFDPQGAGGGDGSNFGW